MARPKVLTKTLQAVRLHLPFQRQLFSALRTLPIPEHIFRHLHFQGPFTVRVDRSRSFRNLHDGTETQNKLFWRGLSSFEPTSMDLWRRLAEHAEVIVDGGANRGIFSLVAGAVNPSATILAFEPQPSIFKQLTHNISLNCFRIIAEPIALSDTSGSATLFLADNVVGTSLERHFFTDEVNASKATVNTVRLDDYLSERQIADPGLIKLDVERHEPAVLRGMANVLDRSQPSILIEIMDAEIGNQVADLMRVRNYNFFAVDEGERISQVGSLAPRGGGQNFLMCTKAASRRLGLT